MGIPPFNLRGDIMDYLQSYLLNRINQLKQYIKLQNKELEKCRSKREWEKISMDINFHRLMLDEMCLIYNLYLEER